MIDHSPVEPSVMLCVELVRVRQHGWHMRPKASGWVDFDDPDSLDPADPRYVRGDHPAVPAYRARLQAEGDRPSTPVDVDEVDELRRRLSQ